MHNFYTDKKLIDVEQIMRQFPKEWELLQQYCETSLEFEVDGKKLKLINEFGNPIAIDVEKKLNYHRQFFHKNSLYKQPLAKALGLKKEKPFPKVLDATGGLLGDSLLMYAMGCQLEVLERHPLVATLIVNALNSSGIHISFRHLSAGEINGHYPVIFFDPMYDEKNSKAAPKKEMQLFRQLVGPDEDLLDVAKHLRSCCDRLVIKRSIKARPILAGPQISFKGKSTAYDVYLADM
jgi:16S rRNA (guanine1516-N2)-methyltransferase